MGKELSTIGKIFVLLQRIHLRPVHILIPIFLAILSAAFEGVGMGLLIPILNGFLQKSFTFILDVPVLGPLIARFPPTILQNDRLVFGVLLVGFIVVFILKSLLRFLAVVSMAYFSERAVHHLRKVLYTQYLSFGKLFFDTTNVGHHTIVLQEFSRNALLPLTSLDKFINSLFVLIVYLVVMLMITWKLTLVAIPLFVLLHYVVRTMIFTIKKHSYAIVERGSALNKRSIEILSTIPLVKAYHTEALEQRRYTQISDEKARLDFRLNALLAMILPMQEIITLLAAAIVLLGVLYIFGRDQIASAPALIVYFYVVINSTSKFGTLSGYRSALASIQGSLDAVLAVLDQRDKFTVRGGSDAFNGLRTSIECRNLTFAYTDRDVLRNVSFVIPHGKMTAIVGPTGSGKSTLISLLMRFYDCPPGSILLDGTDIRHFSLESYLAHTALVSQETLLLHDTLRKNILYGLHDVSEEELQTALRQARLSDFIAELPRGLETLIGDRGVKLSGVEKQRVSIARALLKRADILILDEATSSLDSRTEKLIQEAIDEAVAGRTAIVIAHRLSTIRNADTIVVLDQGVVAEQGALEVLLAKKGLFFRLWEEQKF